MYYTDNIKWHHTFSYQLPVSHFGSAAEECVKLLTEPWSSLLSSRGS